MNAIDYLRAKERLCRTVSCELCPLRNKGCTDLERTNPREMIRNMERLAEQYRLLEDSPIEKLKLKRCPFCGADHSMAIKVGFNNDGIRYYVACDAYASGCGAGSGWRDNVEDAVDAWNGRAGK